MLREITFHRLPCGRLAHRCIALSTFVACTWIACWSAEAQTTTPKKVDSSVVVASHTAPMKMFSQPATQPWDTIGNQAGYVRIQLNRILEHPELKTYVPIMTSAINGVLVTEHDATATLKNFGLSLEGIAQIHGAVHVSLQHDPDQPNGQDTRIGIGVGPTEITTVNQVDWPLLIEAVDLPTLVGSVFPKDFCEKLHESWLNSAKKSRSIVFPEVALEGHPAKKRQPPSESKKALWKAVSGGVLTVVYDISGEAPQEYKAKGALNQADFEMTCAMETAAWGFDLSPDNDSCRIRFAAAPKPEVSIGELINKFDTLRDEITNIAKETDMSDDDFAKHLLEQWKEMKVSIVNGKEVNGKEVNGEEAKDYMLVEGECSGSLIKALNLSKMFKVAK